jgi:hypothetical protein
MTPAPDTRHRFAATGTARGKGGLMSAGFEACHRFAATERSEDQRRRGE